MQAPELACERIERCENVIALVTGGTGKPYISLGPGPAARQTGMAVGFTTATTPLSERMEARDERRLLSLQKRLASLKLLIIDELGVVPLSKTGAQLDRLTHPFGILDRNGDSYRLGPSRARKAQAVT